MSFPLWLSAPFDPNSTLSPQSQDHIPPACICTLPLYLSPSLVWKSIPVALFLNHHHEPPMDLPPLKLMVESHLQQFWQGLLKQGDFPTMTQRPLRKGP